MNRAVVHRVTEPAPSLGVKQRKSGVDSILPILSIYKKMPLFYFSVMFICVCTRVQVPLEAKRGLQLPLKQELEALRAPWCRFRESNSDPWQGQDLLLITEPSLEAHFLLSPAEQIIAQRHEGAHPSPAMPFSHAN